MTTGTLGRMSAARAVADSVLYQGYILYPHGTSRRNRARRQYGVLTPRVVSEADDSERWFARTECIVEPELGATPRLAVQIRCLHYHERAVEAPETEGESFVPVEAVEVDGIPYVAWDEAVDRIIDLSPRHLLPGDETVREENFEFAGGDPHPAAQRLASSDGSRRNLPIG